VEYAAPILKKPASEPLLGIGLRDDIYRLIDIIYQRRRMPETAKAKLFMHGRSQAVRLPKEFRLPGKEVRVRRMGSGVLLEPVEFDVDAWLARLDSYGDVPFMPEGREQPQMPPDDEIDLDR
jgi:antitoxin VapB